MSLEQWLSKHSVTVKRQTDTVGASGGPVTTETTRFSSLPCLVRELPAREIREQALQEGFEYTHEVSFVGACDPQSDERDYFVFTDDQGNTRNLHVVDRFNPFQQTRYITYQCNYNAPADGN